MLCIYTFSIAFRSAQLKKFRSAPLSTYPLNGKRSSLYLLDPPHRRNWNLDYHPHLRANMHPMTPAEKAATFLYLSGCAESNRDYMHPMHAYYHYTTARKFYLLSGFSLFVK